MSMLGNGLSGDGEVGLAWCSRSRPIGLRWRRVWSVGVLGEPMDTGEE